MAGIGASMQRFGAVHQSGCARKTLCSHYFTEHRSQNTPEALNGLGPKIHLRPSRHLRAIPTSHIIRDGFSICTQSRGGKPGEAAFSSNATATWNKFLVNCRSARTVGAVTSTLETCSISAAACTTKFFFVFVLLAKSCFCPLILTCF